MPGCPGLANLRASIWAFVVSPAQQAYQNCPCGSGKKARFCCLTSSRWAKQPAKICISEASQTSNTKCYANCLESCSVKLSREHIFSRSIQKQLGGVNEVDVFGLPFQQQHPQTFSISSLTSKVLCSNHNAALSPLDTEAGRLFEKSLAIVQDFDQADKASLFAGEDIELWMLKTLLGLIKAKQISLISPTGISRQEYELKREWVEILFQIRPWPIGWGLYVTSGVHPSNGHLLICPNIEDNVVTGCHFRVCGKQFFLSVGAQKIHDLMFDFPRISKASSMAFRPMYLNHHRENECRQIILTWREESIARSRAKSLSVDCYWLPESPELPSQDLSPFFKLLNNSSITDEGSKRI